MDKLIECVPNFSEGKRISVIKKIAASAKKIKGIKILDIEHNPSHNRSLITIIGNPDKVFKAAFLMIKTATNLIDLRKHKGEHPRIGATDVVPFVPVSGVSMKECVILAKKLGKKVAKDLNIPVFLYEAAASKPDRVNLANIRKGEYEGLKTAIKTDPLRVPDFGKNNLHPTAGAIVIGARKFLIAYNVNLDTNDVAIAKKIASEIREKNGGLPAVKALGFKVGNNAQVSVNLVDYEKTNIDVVYKNIESLANKLGVKIKNSEIYGMVPLGALVKLAKDSLKADGFSPEQILENKMHE